MTFAKKILTLGLLTFLLLNKPIQCFFSKKPNHSVEQKNLNAQKLKLALNASAASVFSAGEAFWCAAPIPFLIFSTLILHARSHGGDDKYMIMMFPSMGILFTIPIVLAQVINHTLAQFFIKRTKQTIQNLRKSSNT